LALIMVKCSAKPNLVHVSLALCAEWRARKNMLAVSISRYFIKAAQKFVLLHVV
jgi:hypothetical protein